LSPEQAAGRLAEPRSDLYALGCVLYALLSGQPPFTAEHPAATALQHLTATPPAVLARRPDVPPVIDQLLAALLAKDPQDRPPDAATVREWLAQARHTVHSGAPAGTIPIPVTPPEWPVPPGRPSWWRRWPVAVAGGAAIAVVLALLALARAGSGHRAQPAASPAATRPAAKAVSRPRATPHRQGHHPHAPVTPAGAVAAVYRAIVRAEDSGALQPSAASDLQNQLSDISQAISQGDLQDASQKVGDLLNHLDGLSQDGQISGHALAVIGPTIRELARHLPQQS
jgi:serine/threonine-protein kinase